MAAVIALSALCVGASAAETATPSGVGFSEIGKEIEAFAAENEGVYASFATAVFNNGEVVYSKHFGYTDRENKIAADENSVYEWGSISKLLVWVSVMQLHEQGKLDLNADIKTYLPEGFLTKLKYDEPITMLNLMNHNAGWQETIAGIEAGGEDKIIPLGEALKKSEPVQIFRPGEVAAYSNWGAALGGYIVECVSGMDYAQYVHENILAPLGMEHTSVGADLSDNEWVKTQREKQKAYMIMSAEMAGMAMDEDLGQCISWINLYPAGSATSTLADITKFAQAFVADDTPLFEKQETLELMLSASDYHGDTDIPQSCHGLLPTEYAVTTYGHGGNTNGGSSNLVFDPVTKTGAVVLTNQAYEMLFTSEIPSMVFGDVKDNRILKNAVINERTDISGNYVVSRSVFRGMLKIINVLNYLSLSQGENPDSYEMGGVPVLTRVADNLYLVDGSNQFLCATKTSDGTTILEGVSACYVPDEKVGLEFAAVILLAVVVVMTLVLVVIKLIRKLAKKYKSIPGEKAILTGQCAKLTLGGVMVAFLMLSSVNAVVMSVIGILSAAVAVVCVVCAVLIIKTNITEKGIKIKSRLAYSVYILCNFFVAGFVVYFELYNFWV